MTTHIGSTLDSLFEELGEMDEVNVRAEKKGVARAIRDRMGELRVGKAALAKRMETSRSLVDRLLDPANTSVTLATLAKVSSALGLRLSIQLQPPLPAAVRRGPRMRRGAASRAHDRRVASR